ncbi:hypothetical protein [Mycolicibacterium fortuitum]|uniref:hypothetical protein n=1 Tax=Mycolicibacterium fortuitum TaxID=1766 RepID=UPI003AAD06DD
MMVETNNPAQVVEAARRRLRRWLIGTLAALAVAGSTTLVMAATPAPVCQSYGPGPVNNGKAVIAAGVNLHMSEDEIVAGLTAAMRETRMLNLASPNEPDSLRGAHDGLAYTGHTVGILSQSASWTWPVVELMVPAQAAKKFFTAIREEPAPAHLSPAQLAGRVQRSAYPQAYEADEPAARQFYRDHIGEVRATRCAESGSARAEAVS